MKKRPACTGTAILMLGLSLALLAAGPSGDVSSPALAAQGSEQARPAVSLETNENGAHRSIDGSTVYLNPAGQCYVPGATTTICFQAANASPDTEWLDEVVLTFPAGWTVACNSQDADDSGGNAVSFSCTPAGNVITYADSDGGYGEIYDGETWGFCVDVTVPGGTSGTQAVDWDLSGDDWGGAPHDVSGTLNLDELVPGLYVTPDTTVTEGCIGVLQCHTLNLLNTTGADGTFALTYTILQGYGSATGPDNIFLGNGIDQDFIVDITPGICMEIGQIFEVYVEATGNGYTNGALITKTLHAGGGWNTMTSSAPAWTGNGYPVDSCTALNAAGEWVTYVIGDQSGFAGFWGYDHDTNAWYNPGAAGTPTDRWAPDWAYDPDTNLCYLTGGASTPGGGNLAEAFVYDPVANAFTALPDFTSMRDFHDSWVGTLNGVKVLCIGGGVDASSVLIQATQCYDIAGGAWNAENADMGSYPTDPFGSADGTLYDPMGDQFWYVGGTIDAFATVTDQAWYWDDADDAWHSAGNTGFPRYRVEGDFFQGQFYQLGGSSGGFTATPTAVMYDGATWTALDDLPNARMDNLVGVTDASIWSVDGYGSTAADYVDYLDVCPDPPAPPVITLAPAPPLPPADVGVPYSITITGAGGTAPYTFAVTAGAPPPGFSLDPLSGVLSGTAAAPGTFSFTITATDSEGCTGEQAYDLVVCAPITVSPATLDLAEEGVPYSVTFTGAGGTDPYTFAVMAGALPPGLTLDPLSGVLSGTPTTAGLYSFTITATDADGCTGDQAYDLFVCAPITVSPATLPLCQEGIPYTVTFTAAGATAPYTFAVTAGSLPPGLTLDPLTGELSGTPTVPGTFNFTITATDVDGCTGEMVYDLYVCATLVISPANLPPVLVGSPYSVTFTATPGTAPYTFAVTGGTLPPGLTLDPVTGILSGTPTTPGEYTFTITATDANGCTGEATYTVSSDQYDLILYDDQGRAYACVNSATGDWSWTDTATGMTFTGTGLVSLRNGVMSVVSQPGEPWSMTIRIYTRFGIAYGSFIYRAFRVRSSLNDRDILNNPDFCN